ncbi:MAG TPA: ABC transporter substrate-binding protein [Thermodesulfobacteriota bacterium]|nr:ABC transporter substrate-binding protein [Thermodesulfobacteriota bacterium]
MKRLSLSIFLIVLASSVLLLSDLNQRKRTKSEIPKIAMLQLSSHIILEDGIRGILDGLKEKGFIDGQNIDIQFYNAEGDIPTLNTIASEITSGKFDYALTVSTPALQAVSNANKQGKVVHVFGLVTDPFASGIGLDRAKPEDHPEYIVGYGTQQPVEKLIETAMKLNPNIKSIGMLWNSAEANSVVCTIQARNYSKLVGVELLEATVENTSVVYETAASLVSRGVDALLVSGDNTVITALDNVVQAAKNGKIPVITNAPTFPNKGTLLDIGADYYEVGKRQGYLAARVLNGEDPESIPIRNLAPEVVVINKQAIESLKDNWRIPEDILKSVDVVIDENGKEIRKVNTVENDSEEKIRLTKRWNINVVEFIEVSDVEETRKGILEGLQHAGLKEGRDYNIKIQNAQGDMPTVSLMIDNALSQGADMLMTLSTPTLQAAIQRAKNIPVVFTYCASGVNAGAGRTNEDHLPNITGVYALPAYGEMMALFKKLMPHAKKIGTLFVPAESNSVLHNKLLGVEAKKYGVELVSLPANTSTEVPDAALAMAASDIDAIIQIPGNLTAVAFTSIAKAANQSKLPIFAFQTVQSAEGASIVLAKDYYDFGKEAAKLAVRVMRGENPKDMPFVGLEETSLILNLDAAKISNLHIPESLNAGAKTVLR